MFKLIKREIQTIEITDAKAMEKSNTFTSQRPIMWDHVKMLADEMTQGTFLSATIGMAMFEGKKYLTNGQHTIHAVAIAKIPIEATVETYSCESKKDLSSLFRRYDNNLTRSLTVCSKIEADANGYQWKSKTIGLVVTAASMIENLRGRYSKNKKAELLTKYRKQGDFLSELLEPQNKSKHLKRGAVASVIFKTFDKDEADAFVFWENVKTGASLNEDSPEMHLRNFLIESSVRGGRYVVREKEIISKCITAWNAFRQNRKMKLLKLCANGIIPEIK